MNMTVSVKERIPKQRTERRAYVTERARESDSLLVRTDRPGLSMQYKLIATTDASLSDAEKHLRTVYSVLIIKTERTSSALPTRRFLSTTSPVTATRQTACLPSSPAAASRPLTQRTLSTTCFASERAGNAISESKSQSSQVTKLTIIFEYDEQYLREIDNGDFSDQRIWLFIPQILFFDAPLRTAASARAFRSRQN